MKHWIRLPASRHCGGCCADIPKDAPALVITNDLGAKFVRCEACAARVYDQTPPEVIEAPVPPSYRVPLFSAHRQKPDPKMRQAGETE